MLYREIIAVCSQIHIEPSTGLDILDVSHVLDTRALKTHFHGFLSWCGSTELCGPASLPRFI